MNKEIKELTAEKQTLINRINQLEFDLNEALKANEKFLKNRANASYRKQSDTVKEFANKLKALPRDLVHSYQLGCVVLSDSDIDEIVAEFGKEEK